MKSLSVFVRKINTYKITSIINNTKVHKTYIERNRKNEDDIHNIYNKELVAFPYDEDRYSKLLNIQVKKEKRHMNDFFFNSNIYINVENEKIKNIKSSDFCIENIDKYFLFEKEYLDTFFPEGLSGELPKDILMHNGDTDNLDMLINEIKNNSNSSSTGSNISSSSNSNSSSSSNSRSSSSSRSSSNSSSDTRDKKTIMNNLQNVKGVGILYRKLTYEIINELLHCAQDFKSNKKRDSYDLDNYFLQKNIISPYYDISAMMENSATINEGVKANTFSYTTHTDNKLRMNKDHNWENNENISSSYRSRSILIDGKRGTGKSCILNSVVLWAKLNNWFVIFIPNMKKYKFDINDIVRSNTNLYIQPELSRQFLEDIVKVNENFLKEIKINKNILNTTCLDGTHLLYNKRIYDDIIKKTINAEIENDETYNSISEREKNMFKQKLYKFYYDNVKIPNILDKFSIPPNLLELANIGINNASYANLCTYALFEHLKRQTEFPLLIATDQYNYSLSVSEYLSINFENTKYNGYIPTYYFTIPKLLLQWNASKYKRCVKIVATCWDRENRRNFRPDLLGIHKKEIKTVRNYTLREFKNYVAHLFNQNVIYNFDINKLEYFYMLTGGNGFQARKLLTTLY
ncbi:mitochondrial ribosomal protein S29 precursor, putative [Plasmodium malariae]|uniref:Small ribosomal subunit protein mS29 n=2 Tax=Plasmodium malariae TaxID=5858 RepID=A0A1D3SQE9_PLAMA|nr:mitochondrial ribosomal protein S29 precursor, putative [Plasmodium malariae]SCO94119.1 mitochondrial ribosomal protein S29 precursor, putative [Plasmodium malariae]